MLQLASSVLGRGAGAMQAAAVPDQATIDKIAAESAKLVCGKLKGDAEQLSGKVATFIKPELEKSSTIRHITAEVGKEIASRIVEAPETIIEPIVAALTKKFPDMDPNVNLQGLIDAVTARISANKEPPRTEDVIEEQKDIEKQEDKLAEAEEEKAAEEKKPEIVEPLSTPAPNVPLPPPPGAPDIINPIAAATAGSDILKGEGLGALNNVSGLADSAKAMAESTAQNAALAAVGAGESAAKTGATTAITGALGPAAAFMPKGAAESMAGSIVDSAKGDAMGALTDTLNVAKGDAMGSLTNALTGQAGGAEYSFRPELDFSQSTRKRRSKRRKHKKRSGTHITKRRNKHRKKSKTKRLRK